MRFALRPGFLLLLGCSLLVPLAGAQAAAPQKPAHAATAKTDKTVLLPLPEEPARFVYLNPQSVAPNLLEPPLTPKRKGWRAEMDKVVSMQKYAATAEVAMARTEQKLRPEIVTQALRPALRRENLPQTFKLLDNVVSDSRAATKQAKDYWHVPRPYVADKRVKLQINPLRPTNFAYPSGHTSTSLVLAKVLADLLPELREPALKQAGRIAERRIIAGVHSPQDIQAGRQLAEAIYLQLKAQPDFERAMNLARDELVAADLGKGAGCKPAPAKKNWKRFKSRVTE